MCWMHCLIYKVYLSTSESVTVQLTPSSVNVCPGELVTVKCTLPEADTSYTRWTVLPKSSLYEQVDLILNEINNISQRFVYSYETNFRVEWTSFSPLCSTFMTNATASLDGVIVKCSYTPSITKASTITVRGNRNFYHYFYCFCIFVNSLYPLNQTYRL